MPPFATVGGNVCRTSLVTSDTEMCGLHGEVTGCQVTISQLVNPMLTLLGKSLLIPSDREPRKTCLHREGHLLNCKIALRAGVCFGFRKGGLGGRNPVWTLLPLLGGLSSQMGCSCMIPNCWPLAPGPEASSEELSCST